MRRDSCARRFVTAWHLQLASPCHHRLTKDKPTAQATDVSLEWGLAGALAAPEESIGFVVVDVLSFTTAVTVAVSRGTEVVPCPDDQTARRVAVEIPGTAVAVRRSSVDPAHPWSLSPADLDRAPAAGRLAL